jgi:CPA1 family monovalent cation:H+ antiporter
VGTALIFLLVGLAIDIEVLGASIVPIAWAVVAILLARALVVYVLLGGAARIAGRGGRSLVLPLGWLHVMFWAGLRGAVSVALVLSLPDDLPDRALIGAIAFGVVLFTLLVQGSTASFVIRRALATTEEPGPILPGG